MIRLPFRRSGPTGTRPTFLGILLAVTVVVVLGLLWQREEAPGPDKAAKKETVDMEAWSVRLRQREADGRQWSLQAAHAAHVVELATTRLLDVHLEVERGGEAPLTAEAERGRVTDNRSRVILEGDVVVVEPRGYRLTTDSLTYYPAQERAVTEDPVRITADFGEATGIGATLWAAERRVQLHKQVRTQFQKVPSDAS